jgi:phosphoglycolate phosphatase (TIGR01487 family)
LGRIKLVATDVDGTLTERRGSLLVSIEAVKAIRILESRGIKVSLVSGNSLPIVAGLSRYLGASGPAIGENGCLVFFRGEIIHLCKGEPSRELMNRLRELGLVESWQNPFRIHDKAFRIPSSLDPTNILEKVRELASQENMRVLWSGYAIHIQPQGGGKGNGIKMASRLLGISLSEIAVIGDGENDLDMFFPEAFKGCPSDADPKVKEHADYIAKYPGGKGFADFALRVLEA